MIVLLNLFENLFVCGHTDGHIWIPKQFLLYCLVFGPFQVAAAQLQAQLLYATCELRVTGYNQILRIELTFIGMVIRRRTL